MTWISGSAGDASRHQFELPAEDDQSPEPSEYMQAQLEDLDKLRDADGQIWHPLDG